MNGGWHHPMDVPADTVVCVLLTDGCEVEARFQPRPGGHFYGWTHRLGGGWECPLVAEQVVAWRPVA